MKRIVVRITGDEKSGWCVAAKLASFGGDNVALELPGKDRHVFSREDGRWISGPHAMPGAVVLDFAEFEAAIQAGKSTDYEWVTPQDVAKEEVARA
jgi:hypothetical protein